MSVDDDIKTVSERVVHKTEDKSKQKLQRLLEEYTTYKKSYLSNFKFDPEVQGLSE